MNLKYSIVLVLLLISCSGKNEDTGSFSLAALRDSLSAEIMAVHDGVMPKHLELQKLKTQIDEKISTFSNDSNGLGDMSILSDLLDSAYNSMTAWMYEYEPMADTMTKQEILDYYSYQRDKIETVKDLMLECFEKAQQQIDQE